MVVHSLKSLERLLGFLFVLLTTLLFSFAAAYAAVPAQQVSPFADADPAEPDPFVNYLVNKQIVAGFPDGTFRPAQPLTRAQAAALMARAAGLETGDITTTTFRDVTPGHWAFQVIGAAERAGYLSGFPDGTFRPDEALTRAQAAALVMRLAGAGVPQTPLPALADLPPDHWGANAIAAGLDAGVVTRRDTDRFAPNEPFTRLEKARALALGLTLSPDTREVLLAGRLVPEEGTVELKKAGETDYRVVDAEQTVGKGDWIRTGAGSRAEILFDDGSGLLLQAGVRLGITEARGLAYVQRGGLPGVAVDLLEVDLEAGKIFSYLSESYGYRVAPPANPVTIQTGGQRSIQPVLLSQKLDRPADVPWWKKPTQKRVRVQVNMPFGVAGVRGSTVAFAVLPDGRLEITNLTGDVVATSGAVVVDVPPNFATVIASLGVVEMPKEMTIQQLAAFIEQEVRDFLERRAEVAEENRAVPPGAPLSPEEEALPDETDETEEKTLLDEIRDVLGTAAAAVDAARPSPPPDDGGDNGGDGGGYAGGDGGEYAGGHAGGDDGEDGGGDNGGDNGGDATPPISDDP